MSKFFITVLTEDGEMAVAGDFEGDDIQQAIEYAEAEGRRRCPGKIMITTGASLSFDYLTVFSNTLDEVLRMGARKRRKQEETEAHARAMTGSEVAA